jgi:hypothetical protein
MTGLPAGLGIFIPKATIWVYFGGPWNGMENVAIFYDLM